MYKYVAMFQCIVYKFANLRKMESQVRLHVVRNVNEKIAIFVTKSIKIRYAIFTT